MKIVAVLYPAGEKIAKANPELLGCVENALGLREFLESQGHEYVVLSDKEKALDNAILTADIAITTPFWPAYITKERIGKAKNLKLILTAGVGSDHIDLKAAAERGITVAEITGSNVVSVAEHAVMQILVLARNFVPAYKNVVEGGWDIAEIASRAHDIEDKAVGIVGFGRIGQRIAIRLKPFDVKLFYYDFRRATSAEESVFGAHYLPLEELLCCSDIISINCPLTPKTDRLFNKERLFAMKKGAYLINTARGRIVDTDALAEALKAGHLAGYAGDVWYPQPAPKDHPWRFMPNHAMTPHYSGTTLEAQARYASGIRRCLEAFFKGEPIDRDYIIVENGRVTSPSYSYAYEA